MTDHLSTLALHQLRYGELNAEALAAAQAHLDTCGQCMARLEAQHKERAAFVVQPVPTAIRAAAVRRPRWRLWLTVPALALAALALLTVFVTPPPGDQIAFRGQIAPLEVWVEMGEGPRLHRPGEALEAGDRVQLKYRSEGAAYAAVAGRDASGTVEMYGSFEPPADAALADIPFGLTLDDAPGTQELYVILADHPLHSAIVEEAVQRYPASVDGLRVLRADIPKETITP